MHGAARAANRPSCAYLVRRGRWSRSGRVVVGGDASHRDSGHCRNGAGPIVLGKQARQFAGMEGFPARSGLPDRIEANSATVRHHHQHIGLSAELFDVVERVQLM
jgi:hypothetical protein